jgi:hypothetical protein
MGECRPFRFSKSKRKIPEFVSLFLAFSIGQKNGLAPENPRGQRAVFVFLENRLRAPPSPVAFSVYVCWPVVQVTTGVQWGRSPVQ